MKLLIIIEFMDRHGRGQPGSPAGKRRFSALEWLQSQYIFYKPGTAFGISLSESREGSREFLIREGD
jgi:hypothetical protein